MATLGEGMTHENADILPDLPPWLVNFEMRVMYRRNDTVEDLAILEQCLGHYLRCVDDFRANPSDPRHYWSGWRMSHPIPPPPVYEEHAKGVRT